MKKTYFIFLIFFAILYGCEDIFLRFKYEKFNCQNNKFGIEKIWLTNQKINSNVVVSIKNQEFIFQIFDINDDVISFKLTKPEIILKINKVSKTIKGIYQKNIFTLNCINESFRI